MINAIDQHGFGNWAKELYRNLTSPFTGVENYTDQSTSDLTPCDQTSGMYF